MEREGADGPRVLVVPDLTVPGHPEIDVIGDLAALTVAGRPVPGVAAAAIQEGRHVARNIERSLRALPTLPFRYVDKGAMATIGPAAAVANLRGLHLHGFVAWVAWLVVHLYSLIGFRNRLLVLLGRAWAYITFERGARLITGPTPELPGSICAGNPSRSPRARRWLHTVSHEGATHDGIGGIHNDLGVVSRVRRGTTMQTVQTIADGRVSKAGIERESPVPYDGFATMLIGASWRPGSSGTTAPDRDPYTGETLVEIPLANAQDVDEAYRAAEHAQRAWAATLPQERRDVLEGAAHIMECRKEEIVGWLVRESGSTRRKAELELSFARLYMLEAAAYPFHVEGRVLPAAIPGKENYVYRRPVGVVGVISPWNFPLHLSIRSVAPALAVGNAVVLKPASDTPVTGGLLLAKMFEEAGLPRGVLNVVIGGGQEIGDAFVDHPVPRVISFTGSTPVGRHVGEHAGRNVKRVCLELGGNCPFIVFDDAELDRAVNAAVAGKYMHQGQICLAVNRLLVQASIYKAFLERFVERAATLKVGNPAEPDTAIGPLINESQLDRVLQIIQKTIEAGAHPVLRGEPNGLVLPPIVLSDVTNDMAAARQEIFGPAAAVMRFRDEEEAIRIANDTEYGLSSAVFTRDLARGMRVAKRIEAGITQVNDWPVDDEANTAFGGEKQSGLGRFGGEWALEELTTAHWISVQETPRQYPI